MDIATKYLIVEKIINSNDEQLLSIEWSKEAENRYEEILALISMNWT